MKIFFKIFADQSMDNDAENNVAMTTMPKRQTKLCENNPKRSENHSKWLQNRSKKRSKHCMFWDARIASDCCEIRINMEFVSRLICISFFFNVEDVHHSSAEFSNVNTIGAIALEGRRHPHTLS